MPKLGVKGTYFRFDPGASQGDIGGPGGLSGALRLSTSEEAGAVGAITGSRGGPWESFAGVVSPPSLPISCSEEKVWASLRLPQLLLHYSHCLPEPGTL